MVVWDVSSGHIKQIYDFYEGPILDVDWKNNGIFASADNKIYICKVNDREPVKTLAGHTSDINSLKWDPSGQLLASGSDDKTAKIWDMDQDEPLFDLQGHTKDVYAICWSPVLGDDLSRRTLLATYVHCIHICLYVRNYSCIACVCMFLCKFV